MNSPLNTSELTVLFPVYNNEAMLLQLIERIHLALDSKNIRHLILAIDDQSPDNSWLILKKLTQNDSRLGAVRLSTNQGQHQALMLGLSFCTSSYIAIMDADLQDSPELLPHLFFKAQEDKATVFAKRYGMYEHSFRLITSFIHKSILQGLTGIPRKCGTFFVTDYQTVRTLLTYNVKSPQIVVLVACASKKISTLSFERLIRPSGHSAYRLNTLIKAMFDAYKSVLSCWVSKVKTSTYKRPPVSSIIGWTFKENNNQFKGKNNE